MSGATVQGADVLAKNIVTFENKFLEEVNRDMDQVRGLIDGALTRNISLTDHSTADLASMGHPYSRRRPQQIHSPAHQVHTQSGQMLAGKRSGTDRASNQGGQLIARAWAGILESVRHAAYVEWGTTKMVPRDFLGGSLNEVRAQSVSTLRRSLRNTVVSFNGERVKL